jgi:hypothetical protein
MLRGCFAQNLFAVLSAHFPTWSNSVRWPEGAVIFRSRTQTNKYDVAHDATRRGRIFLISETANISREWGGLKLFTRQTRCKIQVIFSVVWWTVNISRVEILLHKTSNVTPAKSGNHKIRLLCTAGKHITNTLFISSYRGPQQSIHTHTHGERDNDDAGSTNFRLMRNDPETAWWRIWPVRQSCARTCNIGWSGVFLYTII